MKIFNCSQIREIDAQTIRNEPVASIDLMERAAHKVFSWLTGRFSRTARFMVFAGPGNNGGDGLAVSRMLIDSGYNTETFCIKQGKTSDDFTINLRWLEDLAGSKIRYIGSKDDLPFIDSGSVVIDAIFGSGLARTVSGLFSDVIKHINNSDAVKVSIDIPSGLFCEDNSGNDPGSIITADHTLSFQFPKLAFMFAGNENYTGEWHILPIGLDPQAIRQISSGYRFLEAADLFPLLKKRKKFDHKGVYGHGLLIAGSSGKMGAAVMSAHAALRTGIGLLTCHIPQSGNLILQISLPEAMVRLDPSLDMISDTGNTDHFTAIGIGPGLGTSNKTIEAFGAFIHECKRPMVIDADGLNILSMRKEWLSLLPQGTILTPHPKEFERIAGQSGDPFSRLQLQSDFSKKYKCIIVLKGAYTCITGLSGDVYFNSTGNPGMATGGSGDVLTGMILSLLAQGYSPENAAIVGVYLHGMAGDIAAEKLSYESLLSTDIINHIGNAFNKIRGYGLNINKLSENISDI
jgi:NAD(P)H-hydrate epimerase